MKAIICNNGMAALIFAENQRFLISAGPMEDGGFSVGIDNVRVAIRATEQDAQRTIRELAEFFAERRVEVK